MPHLTDPGTPAPPVAPRFLPGGPQAVLPGGDPYAWMRDRDLAAMRAYYDEQLDAGLCEELAGELIARVAPAEDSVSWRRDGHTYFTRTVPGQEFEQFCRAGSGGAPALGAAGRQPAARRSRLHRRLRRAWRPRGQPGRPAARLLGRFRRG